MGDLFKALADPTRRAILDELQERDGQTLFELCTRLISRHGVGSSRQAVSQHLDVLEDAGLVTRHREGRYTFLHLHTTPLRAITDRWPADPREDPREDRHDQRPGRRPGEGAALLHRRPGVRDEERHPDG